MQRVKNWSKCGIMVVSECMLPSRCLLKFTWLVFHIVFRECYASYGVGRRSTSVRFTLVEQDAGAPVDVVMATAAPAAFRRVTWAVYSVMAWSSTSCCVQLTWGRRRRALASSSATIIDRRTAGWSETGPGAPRRRYITSAPLFPNNRRFVARRRQHFSVIRILIGFP